MPVQNNKVSETGGDSMTTEELNIKDRLRRGADSQRKIDALRLYARKIKIDENNHVKVPISSTDIEKKIKAEMKKQERSNKDALDLISSAEDDTLEAILIRRYLLFQSIEQVADELHYSVITINRKTKQAIEKIIKNEHIKESLMICNDIE